MPSLLTLRGYMRDWLSTNNVRLPDATATQLLNLAQREICRDNDLRFNEVIAATIAVTQSSRNYALPTAGVAFSRPNQVYYVNPDDPAGTVYLNQISFENWRLNHGAATATHIESDPTEFAIYGSYIFIGPTPKRAFTLYLDYYGILADLSADADHNDLTDFGWEALLFRALAQACSYMFEDDRGATIFEEKATKALRQLRREHERSRYTARQGVQLQEPH